MKKTSYSLNKIDVENNLNKFKRFLSTFSTSFGLSRIPLKLKPPRN